jgi:S-formylglutathione hydrolase FrmB
MDRQDTFVSMAWPKIYWIGTILLIATLAPEASAGVKFRVTCNKTPIAIAFGGRLVVYVKKSNGKAPTTQISGADAFYGVDASIDRLRVGVGVDDSATFYPTKTSQLPPGDYVAQAVLDWHHDDSSWRREPGNMYSPVVAFNAASDESTVELALSKQVAPVFYPRDTPKEFPGNILAQVFYVRSEKLSQFHHRDVYLGAGVVFPKAYDSSRPYPAVYRIPGFGGDGISIVSDPSRAFEQGTAEEELARSAFQIWLDPESGNGHTLFANSDNNGPWSDALVEELIPALESKFHLISQKDARIVRGHSSGGWAALWLSLQYPQTFGACFAVSPDPVDFHCLELIDIYNMSNAYSDGQRDFPGARLPGAKTVREENQIEEVLGPHNTSGQDWDAWQACWGRRDSDGHVASLFDPITGAIDRPEVEAWRRYDITDLLRRNPDRYAPIFHQRIRLIVGDQDTFFLNNAVARLKEELDRHPSDDTTGYIRILPAYDHMSITSAPEVRAWSQQMLEHLGRLKQLPAQR